MMQETKGNLDTGPEPEYNLPCCENCGNVLTIRDPIADSDGQSLLCRHCELLAGYKAGTSICFASGRNYGASFMRALKERSMLDPDAPDAIVVATDQKEVKWLHNHLKKS